MTGLLESYGQGTYGSETYGGTATIAPVFAVEVEHTPGVWEPVDCDVRSIALKRGRSDQLDQFTAATASVTLSDFSDYYNAWHPSGIWSGSSVFRTGIALRVSVVSGYTRTYLFVGTTDDVVDSWPGAGADAVTEVHATDAMKGLARTRPAKLGAAVGAGELPGPRVGRILDAVAYTGPRNLEAGSIALQATILDGTAIALADEAAECEYGAFYVDAAGTIRLRARDSLTTDPRQSTVQWTFDDDDVLGPCYSDLKLIASDDRVYNQATVTRGTGSTPQVATIADSLAWYGPRTYTRDLPINTDVGALTIAQTVVAAHAYNERRIDAIVLNPWIDPGLWPAAIGVQLLDRVRVLRHTGIVIDAELQVQSIEHQIAPGSWTVTLGTTNARTVRDAGQWDIGKWDDMKWSA